MNEPIRGAGIPHSDAIDELPVDEDVEEEPEPDVPAEEGESNE